MRKLSQLFVFTVLSLPSSLLGVNPALAGDAAKGKELFQSICAHCHLTTYDDSRIGAPGLQGVLDRHDEAWLNEWIKSPESFAKTNEIASDLISSNKFGLAMPTLPAMQDDAKRADIIEFLKTLQ